jgi:hypothetical protein
VGSDGLVEVRGWLSIVVLGARTWICAPHGIVPPVNGQAGAVADLMVVPFRRAGVLAACDRRSRQPSHPNWVLTTKYLFPGRVRMPLGAWRIVAMFGVREPPGEKCPEQPSGHLQHDNGNRRMPTVEEELPGAQHHR